MLDFLKKSAPEPVEPATETLEDVVDELHRCDAELAEAGKAIQAYRFSQPDLKTFFIGSITMQLDQAKRHPELARLESVRSRILDRRNGILHRYSVLKLKRQAEEAQR